MDPWQPLQAEDPSECGGFRLTHFLGRGGFGAVFLGFRPDVLGAAAVKIFKSDFTSSSTWLARFRREIEAVRDMGGVHTAGLLDAGADDDPPWIATRYVQAPSLYTLIRKCGPVDSIGGWWLAAGLAEALTEIHAKGIVHRDLKPQNILIGTEGLHVIDFGISRYLGETGVTTAGTPFFGSRQFAAVEQLIDPRDADERTDIFALGGVLVYALTGRPPFVEVTDGQRRQGWSPDLDLMPDELYEMTEACLAFNPENRMRCSAVLTEAVDRLTDFAVPLVAETGPPLPNAHRALVDLWASAVLPEPPGLPTNGGVRLDTSSTSGPDGGVLVSSGSGMGSGSGGGRARQSYDSDWLQRWHGTAKRRRGEYGG
ncbi:serine/threonine protein kinase [Nonomuraea sp. KM88]|uniref:serine/threonine protein kinase n=1 Tax=Nonomuraea sp. KM88 TaxID=3457427 RepID=UPI003FCDCB4A